MRASPKDAVLVRLLERWRHSLDEQATAVSADDDGRCSSLLAELRGFQRQLEALAGPAPSTASPSVQSAVASVAKALQRNAALIRERQDRLGSELQQARRVAGQIRGVRSAYVDSLGVKPPAGWSADS